MMGAGEGSHLFALPSPFLVDERRDALDRPAIVGKNQRRTVPADLVAEQTVDRRPDRLLRQRPELLDRADHTQVQLLALSGIDNRHRPWRAVWLQTAEVACNLFQR